MKLYHGTSARHLDSILRHGLIPREGVVSTWENMPSRDDCVYLTRLYAPYFAANASEDGEHWLIVEVDTDLLDEDLLMPDEDFLEQCSRKMTEMECYGWSMHARTTWFRERLESYQHHWVDSIEKLGNCCYAEGIMPAQLTRYAVFDPLLEENKSIAWAAIDPTITIINCMFCGDKYAELTEQIMKNACCIE